MKICPKTIANYRRGQIGAAGAPAAAIAMMIGLSPLAHAQLANVPFSKNGIGPVFISASVRTKGNVAVLSAAAENGSRYTIDLLELCVRGNEPKPDGCAFTLSATQRLKRGETATWKVEGRKQRGIENPVVSVTVLRAFDPALTGIRTIFVDQIEGNAGAMARERAIAALSNTNGRLRVTEDRSTADAIISGRSESREASTTVNSTEHTDQRGAAVGIAGATLSGASIGTPGTAVASGRANVSGIAVSRGSANTSATSVQEVHLKEDLILKLASPKGEIVWAWDDSRLCFGAMVRCAVDDLVSLTR